MSIIIRLIRWRGRTIQTAQGRSEDEEAGEQTAEGAEEEEAEEGRGGVAQQAEEVAEGGHQGKFEVRVLIGWFVGNTRSWLVDQ